MDSDQLCQVFLKTMMLQVNTRDKTKTKVSRMIVLINLQ